MLEWLRKRNKRTVRQTVGWVESDYDSLAILHELVEVWCIHNKFLLLTDEVNKYLPNITTNADSKLPYNIYQINFKILIIESIFNKFLATCHDTTHDYTTSRLIDLHIRCMTELDSKFVDKYISKLKSNLESVEYLYKVEDDYISWDNIFKKVPHIWLIYIVQNIMRDYTPM